MELWDILDEHAHPTGRTVERGMPMTQDEYHLVVHVWIRNARGEYLISKRTPNKTYPNMWECTGGSAVTGDTSLQAALREAQEEIGVTLSPANGKLFLREKHQSPNGSAFNDVWLFEQEVDIADVVHQPDEVCDAKWATPQTIRAMICTGEFVDLFSYLDDLLGPEPNANSEL